MKITSGCHLVPNLKKTRVKVKIVGHSRHCKYRPRHSNRLFRVWGNTFAGSEFIVLTAWPMKEELEGVCLPL